jgi:hypothetical protein
MLTVGVTVRCFQLSAGKKRVAEFNKQGKSFIQSREA